MSSFSRVILTDIIDSLTHLLIYTHFLFLSLSLSHTHTHTIHKCNNLFAFKDHSPSLGGYFSLDPFSPTNHMSTFAANCFTCPVKLWAFLRLIHSAFPFPKVTTKTALTHTHTHTISHSKYIFSHHLWSACEETRVSPQRRVHIWLRFIYTRVANRNTHTYAPIHTADFQVEFRNRYLTSRATRLTFQVMVSYNIFHFARQQLLSFLLTALLSHVGL